MAKQEVYVAPSCIAGVAVVVRRRQIRAFDVT
jgi:hypothetical protein